MRFFLSRMKFPNLLACMVLTMMLYSCYDENLANVNETLCFTPEFSLPLGSIQLKMEDVVEEYGGELTEIPTQNIPDSILVFLYDNKFYESPSTFEYSETKNFGNTTIASKIEYVTKLMFRINSVSEVPAGISWQVYFLNESSMVIDSLFKSKRLEIDAAKIDSLGNLIESTEIWKFDTELDSSDIKEFEFIDKVQIQAILYLDDLNGKEINYFPEQKIWFQLAIRAELDLPLHEL